MNIKPILLTVALTAGIALTSQAQYTVMRVVESYKDKYSQIQIAKDNGETEKIELSSVGGAGLSSRINTEGSMSNVKLIAETLNKMKKSGHKLVSSSTGAGGIGETAFTIQTYIFEKDE